MQKAAQSDIVWALRYVYWYRYKYLLVLISSIPNTVAAPHHMKMKIEN